MALAIADNVAHRYQDATARLDHLVADYPARSLPLVQRSVAEIGTGRLAAARRDLHRARHLDPHNRYVPGLLQAAHD
jgi:predicted Zn-dependent protease